jgi:hypothetical protein
MRLYRRNLAGNRCYPVAIERFFLYVARDLLPSHDKSSPEKVDAILLILRRCAEPLSSAPVLAEPSLMLFGNWHGNWQLSRTGAVHLPISPFKTSKTAVTTSHNYISAKTEQIDPK